MIKITKTLFTFLLFIGLSFVSISGYSQVVDSSLYFNPIKDDISKKIPHIEALIDSAIANSPYIKWEELKVARAAYDVISVKRDWISHFGIDGLINRGNYFFSDRDELTRLNQFYLTQSKRFTYAAGFYVRFPLTAIIDRRNNISKSKKDMEIAIIQRAVKVREIRKDVIRTYNELMQQQLKLKISNDYQQFSDMMMQSSEILFLNGEIPPEEYSRQKDYQTRGAQAYAETLGLFNITYTLLEETVGFKFNLINVLK